MVPTYMKYNLFYQQLICILCCTGTQTFLRAFIALAETVIDCLYEFGLDQLAGLFEQFVDVETDSSQLTVFAPPNEAIQEKIRLLDGFSINDAINSLFVEGSQPSLDDGDIFVSLAGNFLHITKLETPFSNQTVSCLVTFCQVYQFSTVNHTYSTIIWLMLSWIRMYTRRQCIIALYHIHL